MYVFPSTTWERETNITGKDRKILFITSSFSLCKTSIEKELNMFTTNQSWIIKYITSFSLVSFITLFVASCAMPIPYGAYYNPTYPEKTKYVWYPLDNEGAGPQASLRMRHNGCYMGFRANADNKNFMFSWSQEERGDNCKLQTGTQPFIFEDLDNGNKKIINVFRRVFQGGPGLDINQSVNLQLLIPGFATVPAPEQRYTLSISLRRDFNSSLPEVATIQLPNISIGGQLINLPPLELKYHKKMLSSHHDYIPISGKEVTKMDMHNEFAAGPYDSTYYMWHEANSSYRIAVEFQGFEYKDVTFKSNKGTARIFGHIHIEVLGGESIYMTDSQVEWRHSDETKPLYIPIENSQWDLAMYTTTDLSERHEYFTYYHIPGIAINDTERHYVIVIPDYKPKQFKVILPSIIVNEHTWPIKPIKFKYKYGGVGLWVM